MAATAVLTTPTTTLFLHELEKAGSEQEHEDEEGCEINEVSNAYFFQVFIQLRLNKLPSSCDCQISYTYYSYDDLCDTRYILLLVFGLLYQSNAAKTTNCWFLADDCWLIDFYSSKTSFMLQVCL